MIIANFITEEGLHLMTADRASNNNSHSKSNSNNTPQQQQQGAWPPSSGGGAGDAAAAAAAATTSSDSNGGSSSSNKKKKKQKPLQDDGLRKMGLLSQFKWGCPDNVEEVRGGLRFKRVFWAWGFGLTMLESPGRAV